MPACNCLSEHAPTIINQRMRTAYTGKTLFLPWTVINRLCLTGRHSSCCHLFSRYLPRGRPAGLSVAVCAPVGNVSLGSAPVLEEDLMQTEDSCSAYLAAASHRGGAFLPAVAQLLQAGACARCCLRFACLRSPVYATPAPSSADLQQAVAAALSGETAAVSESQPAPPSAGIAPPFNSSAKGSAPPSTMPAARAELQPPKEPCSPFSNTTSAPDLGPGGTGTAAVAAQVPSTGAAAGGERVCSLCLGVLQAVDEGPRLPAYGRRLALPEQDSNGGDWATVPSPSAAAIAAHARAQGHEMGPFCMELSVPAAVLTRQVAMLYHLQAALPQDQTFADPASINDRIIDVKEALKVALGQGVEAALGAACSREADLRLSLMYAHPDSNPEADSLYGGGPGGFQKKYKRKRGERGLAPIGRMASESIKGKAMKVPRAKFVQQHASPPSPPATCATAIARFWRVPVHVGGRYLKLERGISQSPWVVDGRRLAEKSVQEEIAAHVVPHFRADGYKFMTAGREDADVLMLGDGRPFVIELANSRTGMLPADQITAMMQAINKAGRGVEVRALQPVGKEAIAQLKEGEQFKQKSYTALVELSAAPAPEQVAALNGMREVLLQQQTPVRVSHRRADLVRQKLVHTIHLQPDQDNPCKGTLTLRTQAGTYIKEFVHSDEGRTQPSLGTLLGCEAKILQLDVTQLHLDFLA